MVGSYAENFYVKEPTVDGGLTKGTIWGRYEDYVGNIDNATADIPLLLDGRWFDFGPDVLDPLPINGDLNPNWVWTYADMVAMKRHFGGVDGSFMDGSAKKVDAEDVWNLRWHRNYRPRGRVDLSDLDPSI